MKKFKQIRKPIIYFYKCNRFNSLLNNYSYKYIIYLNILKKYYSINKFDIINELIKLKIFHFFIYVKELKNFFYYELMISTLNFFEEYIKGNIKEIDYNIIYFLAYSNICENLPIREQIIEWNFQNIEELNKQFIKKENIEDLKQLLNFDILNKLPIPKEIPQFEIDNKDILYDDYIIEITTKNTINYIPSIKKVYKININKPKGIIINPRFELFNIIDL